MSEFLSIRWNDANAAKPRPIIGYSLHTDIEAAQDYIQAHIKQHPSHRPELLSDKDEAGARKVKLATTSRLRMEFEDLRPDSINDIWIPVSQKPAQQSLQLRTLQAAFRIDGGSENNLPITLIPIKGDLLPKKRGHVVAEPNR